uniref:Uncharacterized protein n=1 Tax=Romanomermis culicivorax TaxID=13658 RepID=A0A915HTH6_ROMCU
MEGLFTLFDKFFLHETDSFLITLFDHFKIIEFEDFMISSKAAFAETPAVASVISDSELSHRFLFSQTLLKQLAAVGIFVLHQ